MYSAPHCVLCAPHDDPAEARGLTISILQVASSPPNQQKTKMSDSSSPGSQERTLS